MWIAAALLLVALLASVSGARHLGRQAPDISDLDVKAIQLHRMLLAEVKDGPKHPEPSKAYMVECIQNSRAIVMRNDGDARKVDEHLMLVCSRPIFHLDGDLCEDYRESLMGHLHEPEFNMKKLDFELVCKGFHKIVMQHVEGASKVDTIFHKHVVVNYPSLVNHTEGN
eukprot:gnl/TRDRNA2_/TRDRNA2_182349_c0_seq1.p1 gnl/TRDRNA2_/TRDRNA2_182349_c0~~gnl/TRDRNA2_/TRDRNA2_182349_c0_seq1.p1  ORF type:complete len:194 (-),score=47.94 gnl/TRDRNA2_/TRDRNA2_182349_c0_seq1:171-677(-)